MAYTLGVDLGTTYTAAAVLRDGRAEVASLGTRTLEIPSVVLLRDDGTLLIGEPAERRSLTEPGRFSREFKRRIGDPTPILLGGTPFSAHALMAHLLRGVVRMVADREGEQPRHTVVTCPANWGEYKRELFDQVLDQADVGPTSVATEPEAAAVHYASTTRVVAGDVVAVYDLGGGTFDAAVLRNTGAAFELLGDPRGIEQMGGVYFDEAVFAYVVDHTSEAFGQLDPDDAATMAAVSRLRRECVEAKETLSYDTDTTIPVQLPNHRADIRLTRAEFEDLIRPALVDTVDAMRRALATADVQPDALTSVLLVGGSSRIPLVGQMLIADLKRPVAIDVHPKHAVALGAAHLSSPETSPVALVPQVRVATLSPPTVTQSGPTTVTQPPPPAPVAPAGRAPTGPPPGPAPIASPTAPPASPGAPPGRAPGPPGAPLESPGAPAGAPPDPRGTPPGPSAGRAPGAPPDSPGAPPGPAPAGSAGAPPESPAGRASWGDTGEALAVPVAKPPARRPAVVAGVVVAAVIIAAAVGIVLTRGGGDDTTANSTKTTGSPSSTTSATLAAGSVKPVQVPQGPPLDTETIAYTRKQDTFWNVWLIGSDGSNPRALTREQAAFPRLPAISPDRRTVAYTMQVGDVWQLRVIDTQGSGDRLVTDKLVPDARATWSPDGKRLAFVSDQDGTSDIYIIDLASGTQTNLTHSADDEGDPAWSPDGKSLAYWSVTGGNQDIYVIPATGGKARRLTTDPADEGDPAWLPDGGDTIAFSSQRDGDWEIFTMAADGSGQRQLTSNDTDDQDPAWAPDGAHIAFESKRDAPDRPDFAELYVMSTDGADQHNITNRIDLDIHPSWGTPPTGGSDD